MKRILIEIEYDGRNFCGWQRQGEKRSVQGEIEKALKKMLGVDTEVFASGRTDSGVHALGQCAHFDHDCNLPVNNIPVALNHLLPSDISIKNAEEKEEGFHARFSVVKKTYLYQIYTGNKSALISNRFAHVEYSLDFEKMKEAATLLVGRHNFRGFCCSHTHVTDFEREIFSINISQKGEEFFFEITGSGFLYNMVRIIVGTLIDVGRGLIDKNQIAQALSTQDRSFAGVTMPPEGLFLKKVYYE